MKQCTLIFPLNEQWEILLGMKKRWFGMGKWNGLWWKKEPHETIEASAVREIAEESGIIITENQLAFHWTIQFIFQWKEDWNQIVYIYSIPNYQWEEPVETEEMNPKWFSIHDIPFDSMWEDDPFWLPRMLQGETILSEAIFDENGKLAEWRDL